MALGGLLQLIGGQTTSAWVVYAVVRVTVELLRVSAGIAALSGLYYSVAVLTDSTYREEFLEELTDDLRTIFADRARYLELRAP